MNNLQLFNSPQFGEVRAMLVNEEPYFVGRDVCKALGYVKPENALAQHVDIEDTLKQGIPDNQGFAQQTITINESGVYSLVFGSKLPQAKAFKRWVTSEVLPTIRKHGGYLTQEKLTEALTNPDTLIQLATQLKTERAEKERLSEQNELHKQQLKLSAPKVEYYNEVLQSESTYNSNQIAKELGLSAVSFNARLQSLGVQYRQHGQWLLYSKHQDKGYTKTHTYTYTRSDGSTGTSMQTVWTEKGREFAHKMIK